MVERWNPATAEAQKISKAYASVGVVRRDTAYAGGLLPRPGLRVRGGRSWRECSNARVSRIIGICVQQGL